jgi:uncharacterized membrane protein YczE
LKIPDVKQRLFWLVVSIVLNAASNALAIATNMGSAVWTASGVNLSHWVAHSSDPVRANLVLGNVLVLYGVAVAIFNILLTRQIDWGRLVRNILFVVPFSYLVQWIVPFWRDWLKISQLQTNFQHPGQLFLAIILDIIGLFGVAVSVSLYQRANLIMHPNDDLSYILRFKYLRGRASAAQWASYVPPLAITALCFFVNHQQLWAFGFGTVWAFLTQGYAQGWADEHVVPHFKHHFTFKNQKTR